MSRALARSFLTTTLSCFAAGVAVGLAVPAVAAVFREPQDIDAQYVDELRARYDLSRRQVREIRMVLERERSELLELVAQASERDPEIERQRLEVKNRAEERIKFVLTSEQRERFLRDAELNDDRTERGDRPEQASGKE